MNANLAAVLYLVSGVLFILALRGLSSPVTSRRGNQLGMVGMALAVGTTLATLWSQGALDGITLGLLALGGCDNLSTDNLTPENFMSFFMRTWCRSQNNCSVQDPS